MDKTVIDILEFLEETSGSNAKKDILQLNKGNELLRRVFVAAGDSYVTYFVNKFKTPRTIDTTPDTDDVIIEDFVDFTLPNLARRVVTGDAAKALVINRFSLMTARQQKWCLRILLKNLRVGVQETTVNKVWPGSLNKFTVALAETLKSEFVKGEGIKLLESVSYPVRLEPKLDGLRCIAVKKDGLVTFYTRSGTVLETLPTIKGALEAASYDNVVLDAEGLAENSWNLSSSVIMSSKGKKDDSALVLNVFDAIPLGDWLSQQTSMPYSERCELVNNVVSAVNAPCVKQVPHIMAKDEEELRQYFSQCLNDSFEGIMCKRMDTPYVFKRSKNILKLKPCATFELMIVGHYEGRRGTNREGQFGGFIGVASNGVTTRVGGGFNDAMRAQIQLEGPDSYVGRIMEVEGQPDPLTTDGFTTDGCVRFPVWCRMRDTSDVDPKLIEVGECMLASVKELEVSLEDEES